MKELSKIAIIGAGSLGDQLVNLLSEIMEPDSIYFDDPMVSKKIQSALPFSDYRIFDFDSYNVFIGLGYKHLTLKEEIYQFLKNKSVKTPNYFHKSGYLNKTVSVGDANFIYPLCSFEKDVEIGTGNIFNSNCSVSHDSKIGDFNFFGPGVTVSGNVTIASKSFIGAGSTIVNDISIGSDVIIGAGTLVNKDILSGQSVVGNPMRVLSRKLRII